MGRTIRQRAQWLSLGLVLGCGGGTQHLADPSSQTIAAASGGIITLSDGATLTIPAGALHEDTLITVTPVQLASDEDGSLLYALRFGPSGVILQTPARVRFPLPADWDGEDLPIAYESIGDDPADAMPNAEPVTLLGEPGAYQAETNVYHFSCAAIARNCHAGTIRWVLSQFEARGCDRKKLMQDLNQRFTGVGFSDRNCASAGAPQVQALLDTYFEDLGGFDPGQPMSPSLWAEAIEAAREGRQVVLAFTRQPWTARGGRYGFYPSGPYAHTATLRLENDQIVVHNTIKSSSSDLRRHFGGEVTATWPADRIEEFRSLQLGVALEIQLCGAPDCLSSSERNSLGLDVYPPLAGVDWTDPDCWLSLGQACRPPRPVAWPGVRVYIERTNAGENPCADQVHEAHMSAEVDIPPLHRQSYIASQVVAGLGTVADGEGKVLLGEIPTISGFRGTAAMPSANLSVSLHPALTGPGTYTSFGPLQEGAQAMLMFFTEEIAQDGLLALPVVFTAVSGSVTIERWGSVQGDALKGSFDVIVEGNRQVCDDAACEEGHTEVLRGTMLGTFEGEMSGPQG